MAVDPNIDELLKRLASSQRLPATQQPFRTQQAQQGARLRDAALGAFRATPRLSDAVQQIQQGGSAQTGAGGTLARVLGSPVGKVALGGLNIIDMPRRAVITGLKELNDYIDIDPNTKASFKDLRTQFNDPSFGFGRVVPQDGWKGRIVGFIGDVVLDPLTYVTLGGTVPAKAVAKGAGTAGLRATAKVSARDMSLRAALGTKNVTGREGRFALANLVRQYGGNVDEVAAVAARGKSAVPDDIAKVIGLQRNGLYMFGSRVRIPGSGVVGQMLEAGIVKARLGIVNTPIGKKLQYLYTPKGASGTYGDLKNIRADFAAGRLPKEKVDLVIASLRGAENGRARGASYGQQYLRDARAVATLEYVQSFDDQIHRFIETADPLTLSPSQREAVAAVQDHWERVRILLEQEGQRIDPSFRLNVGAVDPATGRPRYMPHIQTSEMYRWRQKNSTSPWALLLDKATSVDVLDMNNNLASRFFKVGDKFLETEDVIKYGTIDELNALWRKHSQTNFDMFETSTQRILAGYEQTVRGAFEAFTLMDELKNSDLVRLLRTQGEIDPDFLKTVEKMAVDRTRRVADLTASARAAAEELSEVVRQSFDTKYRRSVASTVQRGVAGVRGEVRAAERAVADAAGVAARAESLTQQLSALVEKQQAEAAALAAMFEDKNMVMMFMNDALLRSYDEAMELQRQAANVRRIIDERTLDAQEAESVLELFEQKSKDAAAAFRRAEETMEYYRLYGDELGPALQNIYERIRLADSTVNKELAEPEDYARLTKDIEEGVFSGDPRVNQILNILMRPFDSTPLQSSRDLGQKWLSDSLDSVGDSGVLLRSIPDLGAPKGVRATRKNMARAGKTNKRSLTGAQVNDIIGRASTIGDNYEEMADAFFFMTARELRAVFDSYGGGAAGQGAQDALARELLEGVTERAKIWREAKAAVEYVQQQTEVLRSIASKSTQRGGRLERTSTIEQIAFIDEAIANLDYAVPEMATNAFNRVRESVETFSAIDGSANSPQFAKDMFDRFGALLESLGVVRPEIRNHGKFLEFELVVQRSQDLLNSGAPPTPSGVKQLFDQIEKFVKDEFTNADELAALRAEREALEKSSAEALKIDKQFIDTSNSVLESTKDAGVKLANYHILHATRLAVDAISALTPFDSAPGEALFAFARSGAARQQLKHLTDFQKTIFTAEQVMEKIRNQVFGGVEYAGEDVARATTVADRALVLRQAVQNLTDDEKEALYSVIGDLSYVEKQIALGTKIETVRRTTPQYASIRDRIWSISTDGADWRSQIEIDTPYYTKTRSRARTYKYADDAARMEGAEEQSFQRRVYDDEGNFLRFEYGEEGVDESLKTAETVEGQINAARNRINRMENASPEALNKEINRLVGIGKIDSAEADELRRLVGEAEQAAKAAQKAARENANVTGKGERAAKQKARGVLRSADETFGISRAFWFATRTNADGRTLSNQRVLDFFTMVLGDGEIRVSNSGGWKRPQAVLEGDEQRYREFATNIINKAKADKRAAKEALPAGISKEARAQALRDIELDYWRTLGNEENDLVDVAAVERLLGEMDKTRVEIRFLKAERDAAEIGSYKKQSAEASLQRAQGKLKSLQNRLNALEREATQLVTRGTDSPKATYKYIPVSESALGRAGMRTRMRISALRTLARDPEAGASFTLSTGIDRNEVLAGTYGYVEFLRGKARELDGALEAVDRARGEVEKVGKKIGRASAVRQQDIVEAEAIAANPGLQRRVEAAINVVSDDEAVRSKATRQLVRSKQWTAKEGPLPPRTAKLVNEQRKIKKQILEIEKTAEYTAAVERQFKHKVLMALAGLDLSNPNIEFPKNVYDEEVIGALQAFAKRGEGVRDGLDPLDVGVYRMSEVVLDDIANEILQSGRRTTDYFFAVGTQRVPEKIVRDIILKRNGAKFRYVTQTKAMEDGSGRMLVQYLDKGNGSVLDFGEVAPKNFVAGELVLDDPIYVSKMSAGTQGRQGGSFGSADRMGELYFDALNGNLSSFKTTSRVTRGKNADGFFDPVTTYAVYSSPTGGRIYRMDSIVGVGREQMLFPNGNPLDPRNIFDERQGRGIIANFESLFQKPVAPLSPEGKKLRANLAAKRAQRDKVVVKHAQLMDEVRAARTQRDRRAAQGKAADLSQKIDALDRELETLAKQIKDSNPVTQMVMVENVGRIIEFFRDPANAGILRQLGVKVDGDVVGDGDVLRAIEKYVEALEYQKLNPATRVSGLTGRVRGRTGIDVGEVDAAKGVVGKKEVNRRRRVLTEIFDASPEGKLIASVKSRNDQLAANQKALITIKNGGEGAELLAAKRATLEELGRAERNLKLNERDLGKALRKQKTEPLPGETPSQTAARVAAEEEQRLAAKPLQRLDEAITDDARAAAARGVAEAKDVEDFYEAAQSGALTSLKGLRAEIAGRESILKTLRARETEIIDRIAVIGRMLDGEKIPANQRAAMTDELRSLHLQLHGVPRTPKRAAEKGLNEQITDALKVIEDLHKSRRRIEAELVQARSAADMGFYLELNLNDARKRLDLLNASLEDMRGLRSRARVGKKDGWMEDFDEFASEVSDVLMRLNSMEDGPDTRRLASVLTGYLEAKANLLRGTSDLAVALDMERMVTSGQAFGDAFPMIYKGVVEEGWQRLTGSGALASFENLQMRPEVAEILSNMGRLRDPAFVKSMRVWFGPYTRFFKAWALSTPGYHVRNSFTNAFMLVAAGGRPQFLADGMREYNALYRALKKGTSIDTYLANLPESRRQVVGDAYRAMMGSGVGQSEEIAFDTAGVLTNNPVTRANRRVGAWVEQHSRFMLAYDGIRQGYDVNGATARVRKYLFDYEDISNLDATMRSIIPFWMWTSRNLPLTIQNIYMNPRPYQWYQSLRRNTEDEEKTQQLPLYMREAGGFALAGTGMAATPDLGFNRLQADVNMLTNPTRFAANVNPLLRVPFETMLANKSFFRNREFQREPLQVDGPVGTLASLLGQPIGAGGSVGGQRFVDEKMLYALGNLVPALNQVERFIPSQEYYQQRGSTNPLLGYLGAPVRQVTPEMLTSEQRRRLAELQKLLASQPKPQEG